MFNHPTGRQAASRQFTTALCALDKWGEAIWDHICFLGCQGEPFTTRSVVEWLQAHAQLSPRTARNYWTAFVAYTKAAPEDFSGPASRLVRAGNGTYRLIDNPER